MAFRIGLPGRGRRFWVPAAVLILVVAGAAVAFIPGRIPRPEPPASPPQAVPAAETVELRDFAYASSVRGQKVFTLKADSIIHRRRKLGPLTINPIKEVEMNGVRIEIVQGAASGGGSASGTADVELPIRGILSESLSSRDLGFVSRVLMNRLRVAVVRDQVEQLSIVARAASAGLDSGALHLERGVTLTTRSGQHLEAQAAEWRFDSRRLVIPGAFVMQDGRDIHPGERTTFRIGADGRLHAEK